MLTAAITSRFVRQDAETDEIKETLRRIESDVNDLKHGFQPDSSQLGGV